MVGQTITMTSGIPATMTNSTAAFIGGFASGSADVFLDNIMWSCSAYRQAELSGINTAHASGNSVDFLNAVGLTDPVACYTSEGDTVLAVRDSCGGGTYDGGGGIFNTGTLTVKNASRICGNFAPIGYGADVYNLGELYLSPDSEICLLYGDDPI